jgi:outer membrane protein assembly factor BamB
MRCAILALIGVLCFGWLAAPAGAEVRVEQIISREHPAFKAATARLTVGRDGNIYLCNMIIGESYVLRIAPDGSAKLGSLVESAAGNATANKDGIIAIPHSHFGRKVTIHDPNFKKTAEVGDFLGGDAVGWDAPARVEAGEVSGDFYAIDQHRDRIVRISPAGKVVKTYALPPKPERTPGFNDFRVSETHERFYLAGINRPEIVCVDFDGQQKWVTPFNLSGGSYQQSGGFDIDAEGNVYAIEPRSDVVVVFSPDGQKSGEIQLEMNELKPGPGDPHINALRLVGDDIVIHRVHPTEMFQRYERATGRRAAVVHADHERLAAVLESDVVTRGQRVPFKIEFDTSGRKIEPHWRIWARPAYSVAYESWDLDGDGLLVPDTAAGLYQVKVTPEVVPWQRKLAPEYRVEAMLEVRAPNHSGTVAALTPRNRTVFARGEAIPVSVVARLGEGKAATPAKLRLLAGERVVHEQDVTADPAKPVDVTIAADITRTLEPGHYTLAISTDDPTITAAGMPILIGSAVREHPFHLVEYADYRASHPIGDASDAPDQAAAHAERLRRLGFNLVVDRLGAPAHRGGMQWPNNAFADMQAMRKRLESDPTAMPPERLDAEPPLAQALAGYGAQGIQHMAILMGNDAGLPVEEGLPFDNRKPDQILQALQEVMDFVRPYAAFRGWVWSSNWWVHRRGGDAAETPEQKQAYNDAVKLAQETGQWSDVLDTLSNIRLGHAVRAQQLFKDALDKLRPGLVTASAAPFRNVDSYPPVTFSNVDEVDLQAQWEQIAVPYHGPLNVDFYKRPGKRAWGHPEIWNDDGTGGQIVSVLMQMVMRGADGVGTSGPVWNWEYTGANVADPRSSSAGITSIHRSLGSILTRYGPWLATMESDDRVAILASGRMLRIDTWKHVTGLHFARLYEAYISCLHAHQPATFVFPEDVTPDSLKAYKAVLVVGQRVQLDPPFVEALKNAAAAGTAVFYDGTTRAELLDGIDAKPLGLSFDKLEHDPNPAGDDSAYWRFRDYARANAPQLAEVLGAVAPPPAVTDDDEVQVSQRRAGRGRYVFVVNNTTPDLSPGMLWRVTLALTSRVPLVANVKLAEAQGVVYDVFAQQKVELQDGIVQADLRTLPARIYAILPAEIASVAIEAGEGQTLTRTVRVLDAAGQPIDASIPLRVRVRDGERVIDDIFAAAEGGVARVSFDLPAREGRGAYTVEAVELISGKATEAAEPAEPVEHRFGPRLRDVALSADGSTALFNASNWDHNLYAIDTATGEVRWRQKIGDHFAFDPRALDGGGFVAQSYDLRSSFGYALHRLDASGQTERRFALYGLPTRLPHRFVPGLIKDRINNFAAAPDGSWIASAGDLGLVVWSSNGQTRWQQDWWKEDRRREVRLAAIDDATLLVVDAMTATAYDASSGEAKWQQPLAASGDVWEIRVSADRRTVALLASTEGGRLFVLREGKIHTVIPTGGQELDLSPDGSLVAVTDSNLLKLYSVDTGLRWTLSGDDRMHHPSISRDGARVAAGSELGTLYVVSAEGELLRHQDLQTLPVPTWLEGNELLVGTWAGEVKRLGADFAEKWSVRLKPEARSMRGRLLNEDDAPLTQVKTWNDADESEQDLSQNVLAQTGALIRFVPSGSWGGVARLMHDPKLLIDTKPDAPAEPWIEWNKVGFFAETSPINYILIDTYIHAIECTAITFVEDPAHPESWLRDGSLEYFDFEKAQWTPVTTLLADAAVHTHKLPQPVTASRWRIMLPRGVVGNLRLGEIMLHGKVAGAAHPDVLAKRDTAVAFDEGADVKDHLLVTVGGHYRGSPLTVGDAYSGGHRLRIPGEGATGTAHIPPYGHALPLWDFEIVENPQPGQYRYLSIAWRADAPETKGLSLRIDGVSEAGPVAARIVVGERPAESTNPPEKKLGDTPPQQWQVVTVDLWELLKRPSRLRYFRVATAGGGGSFDRILLGRTEEDVRP